MHCYSGYDAEIGHIQSDIWVGVRDVLERGCTAYHGAGVFKTLVG